MRHPFFIRPARSEDSPALDALLSESYPALLSGDYSDDILDPVLPLITQSRPELLACGTYYLAECVESGEVVGAGGWSDIGPVRGAGRASQGHVRHVATRADWTRRGVASSLIEVALASAEAHGMTGLTCMSTRTAREFYAAMGFSEQGEVELTLAPGVHFPVVQMGMSLN